MGTRCLTIIKNNDEKGKDLLTIYRQFDGYPHGHGKALRDFLMSRRLVDGYQGSVSEVNGMGDLAAQLLCHLKWFHNGLHVGEIGNAKDPWRQAEGPYVGNVYVYPNGSKHVGEEYIYVVSHDARTNSFHLKVYEVRSEGSHILYEGLVGYFDPEMSVF
jgi:hypothetical protein